MGILFDITNINMEHLVRTVITRAKEEDRPQGDILKEEIMKIAQCPTDQDKDIEHSESFDNIIPPGTDIDNNQVYDVKTGKTIKEL